MTIKVESKAPIRTQQLLLTMASRAIKDVRARAFPHDGSPAKSVEGEPAAPLSETYRKRKVAKGHHGVSDQRFTSGTANALGVTRDSAREVRIGWRERGAIAEGLDTRNKFWGLSAEEHARVVAIAEAAGKRFAAGIKITGRIVVRVR